MAMRSTIERLEDHPNLGEVLGVLAQLAQVSDADLPRLAAAWINTTGVAEARDRALSPDSPLVLEVLSVFEAIAVLFEDDLLGEAPFVTVDKDVTATALKAIRDGVAAAYARPMLTKGEHAVLLAPWRAVYPTTSMNEPDLGPEGPAVKALLTALTRLAGRCHDTEAADVYEALLDRSFLDESDRARARDTAFQAAVLTSRRRTWALVRRSGAEGLSRPCRTCRDRPDERELSRVMTICLDAACALLVADAVPDDMLALLTEPMRSLIPLQRQP